MLFGIHVLIACSVHLTFLMRGKYFVVLVLFSLCHLLLQVIACFDVRTNDRGDLVVTKGDQYDVREHSNGNEVWYNLQLPPSFSLCVCPRAYLLNQVALCILYLSYLVSGRGLAYAF